jgi:RNA polymerase sigma factor (sigma-70 family)
MNPLVAAGASTGGLPTPRVEIGVSEMDGQRGGRQWDDSPEGEAEFRQTLLRLKTEGASNQEIAEQLMRSPFVLELVKKVTGKNELKTGKGARTPAYWWTQLRKDPELREEWRCETVCLLGSRLRAKPDKCGDLDLNVGGFWRMKVVYAAIRASWNLHEESRSCGMSLKEGANEFFEDKTAEGDLMEMELRLDLAMLIDGLENPRQREVMRLSAMKYDYPEIAVKLGISYEQVRYAVEEARKVLQTRLRRAA